MDLVANHKDKLSYFRIKELKDILTQLGMSKQGKKQDLIDRILAILSDERVSGMWAKKNAVTKEQVAKLVDDTYRKMKATGVAEVASKEGVSDSTHGYIKEETEDSYQKQTMRCLCGNTLATDSMIKCEDPRCNVWQHMTCVIIPDKPVEGAAPVHPENFFCAICRLNRADPFWLTVSHPLHPVKLNITNVPTDGSNPGQSIEKTFQLSRSDRDMLSKQDYDLQAWCMLINDKVTFRMQWPQYADLQVNDVPVRAINRPGSQLLGANGRDDGPIITPCTRDGLNKISLTGCDSRIFCLGVRIVKRRTLRQVLNMIPKEAEGESFEDALARVRRCVGGGPTTENADSDSDIEVVADSIPVNLRCPMSGLRMNVAGRFRPCMHMGCFDLEVFVEMNQRSRKWQCPICLKNYSLEKIIIDPYFNRITSKFQQCGEDLADIEVKPDGSWRAKPEGDRRGLGELGLWHFPDGSICPSMDAQSKLKQELKPTKPEAVSDSPAGLKLGIKKNENGLWVFNKPDVQGASLANRSQDKLKNNGQNVIPMSSSATGSGKDCEDASVNQDFRGSVDVSTNGIEYESFPMNLEPTDGFNGQSTSVTPGGAEVIFLSDSEEEIEPVLSSGVHNQGEPGASRVPYPLPNHEIPDSYFENTGLGNGSCLDIYGSNDDDFGVNMWPMPSDTDIQGGSGFQLFGPNDGVSNAMVDMHHGSLNCPSSISDYPLTTDATVGSTALESTTQLCNINDSLVDNHMAYNGNDPSLQIFLPTRPLDTPTVHSDFGDPPDVSNGVRTEDWISLRLGDSGVGQHEHAAANGLNSGNQTQCMDGASSPLADTGMNENRPGKTTREGPGSPFSFPRQRRSVRPRLHLSFDSPSE